MSRHKKSRPSVAAPGRQAETGTFSGATTSATQHTTRERVRQPGKIEGLLSPGAENALPLRRLVKLTGLPARQVRQLIQAERLHGTPILADNHSGYFLPGTPRDVEKFARSMRHRAEEIIRAANAVQNYDRGD